MQSYSGKVTTVGSSEAIRLDKTLFKSHPEFHQKAKVRASYLSKGHILISVDDDGCKTVDKMENDPVLEVFLDFLDKDMRKNPSAIKPIEKSLIDRAEALTNSIECNDDDVIPDEISLND